MENAVNRNSMYTTNNTMIYQLKYPTKEIAIADLLQKGVYTEDLQFGNNIQAIVEIGVIVDTPVVIGYHFDVMTEEEIIFDYIVNPVNPKHKFL